MTDMYGNDLRKTDSFGTPRGELKITPADEMTNVINALIALVDGPAVKYRMDAIKATAHQVREQWEQYLAWVNADDDERGQYERIDDGSPF